MAADTTRHRRSSAAIWQRLRGATAVAVGMAIMNVAAYGFTLVAVHALAPADFGALTALLGLVLIGNVASLGLQATGARRIAVHQGAGQDLLAGGLLRAGRYTAAGLAVLSLAVTPLVMWLLHIDSVLAVLLLAPTLALLTLMGSQAGVLQGGEHWRELAAVYASQGLGRLVGGGLGLLVAPNLVGAMVGLAIGSAAPAALGGWLLRGSSRGTNGEVRHILGETVHGTHTLLAFYAIANTDVLLARTLLDAHDSGIYASGVIVAKACLFLPQFVVVVVFPSLAVSPGDTRRLGRAIAAIGGLGVCAVIGSLVLRNVVVAVVGGDEYAAVGPIAWLFALAGSAYAVLQLVAYAAIAEQEKRAALAVWAGLAVLVAVALVFIAARDVDGLGGVKLLAATTSACALALSGVLAAGLHRNATTQPR